MQTYPFPPSVRLLHRSRGLPLSQSAIGTFAGHTYMYALSLLRLRYATLPLKSGNTLLALNSSQSRL